MNLDLVVSHLEYLLKLLPDLVEVDGDSDGREEEDDAGEVEVLQIDPVCHARENEDVKWTQDLLDCKHH